MPREQGHDLRANPHYQRDGSVLNREPWRDAPILIAGANFGSGSSREQAVWALLGRGITCVVAPSFGEIFDANCLHNGVLPIILAQETVSSLMQQAGAGARFTIDLDAQMLLVEGGDPVAFTIGAERRLALLNG